MSWIRDLILILILTSITGSLLMLVWMAIVYTSSEKLNIRYVYWMLRGVLAGYLFSFIYLLIHRCIEHIRNDFDILSVSTVPIDKVFFVLFIIWLVGRFILLLSQLHMWGYLQQIKRSSVTVPREYICLLQKLCIEMKIRRSVCLYQGYGVKSPFIFGVQNPKIYLPVKQFSTEELEIVLYHELVHYKQGDIFWKPIFGLISNIYWFSPLSRLLWKEAARWIEANCDTCCCEEKFDTKKYFALLLEMGSIDRFRLNDYVPMWTEDSKELKWRVKCMKRHNKKKPNITAVAAIVIISILGSVLSAHAATQEIKMFYQRAYFESVEATEEPLNYENELQEYYGSLDEFAGMEITEHQEEEINFLSTVGTIDWTVNNNATHYTGSFKVNAGGEIKVLFGINPSDKEVRVGILKPDKTTSYVKGKNSISHTFRITKTGYYKVFISNTSGAKITASGSYIR